MGENMLIAFVGVLGAVIGAIASTASSLAIRWFDQRPGRSHETKQQQILKDLLEDNRFQWRALGTLANVIGADEETTKRLLIAVGARGSEDGGQLWGLLARNPLARRQ